MSTQAKKLIYGSATLKGIRVKVEKEVMREVQSNARIRSEIKRVFQMANRRIQNIRTAGLVSPALTALGEVSTTYTVFSMKGSFTELKLRYAKAISFLQQPTSTASGARTYSNYIKTTYNLSDSEFKATANELNKAVQSLSDSKLGKAMLQYKDFTGYFEASAGDSAALIERAAVDMAEQLDNAISNIIDDTTLETLGGTPIDEITKLFDDFGI